MPEGVDNEKWSLRIDATTDAQRRSRYVFIVVTIVAAAIAIAEFNATWSWYIQFPLENIWPDQETRKEAVRTLIQQWIKSSRMTVSLLGVDIGMSDAALLGSISLYIISLWFFFCIRRENHLIGKLLIDGKDQIRTIKEKIFYGITGHLVFTTMSDDDDPISTLNQTPTPSNKRFFLRWSIQALIFLPCIAIFFIVFSDVASLRLPSPIRPIPAAPAAPKLLWEVITQSWTWQLFAVEMTAMLFGGLTLSLCSKILKFEKATGKILREFEEQHLNAPSPVVTPVPTTPAPADIPAPTVTPEPTVTTEPASTSKKKKKS